LTISKLSGSSEIPLESSKAPFITSSIQTPPSVFPSLTLDSEKCIFCYCPFDKKAVHEERKNVDPILAA
jgi:hypothetical protein